MPKVEPAEGYLEPFAEDLEQVGRSAAHHVREMYPEVQGFAPSTFLTSLRNHCNSQTKMVVKKILQAILDRLDVLPDLGEPSFTLLGRDPQAPRLVELWAHERNLYEGVEAKPKVVRANTRAAEMREYKQSHPDKGMPVSRMSSTAQMGYDDIKNDGTVTLHGVFNMRGMNRHMTALNIYRGPTEYLVHLMDGATMLPIVGFLSKEDLLMLRDRLLKELPLDKNP